VQLISLYSLGGEHVHMPDNEKPEGADVQTAELTLQQSINGGIQVLSSLLMSEFPSLLKELSPNEEITICL